jgi:hypothetical protein
MNALCLLIPRAEHRKKLLLIPAEDSVYRFQIMDKFVNYKSAIEVLPFIEFDY